MGKYDHILEENLEHIMEKKADVFSSVQVAQVKIGVAIANELAELNEFLGKRMPKPMSREDLEEMMRKQ